MIPKILLMNTIVFLIYFSKSSIFFNGLLLAFTYFLFLIYPIYSGFRLPRKFNMKEDVAKSNLDEIWPGYLKTSCALFFIFLIQKILEILPRSDINSAIFFLAFVLSSLLGFLLICWCSISLGIVLMQVIFGLRKNA